jgi:beta-mannosidase
MTNAPTTFTRLTDGWTVTAVSGPTPDGFPSEPVPAVVPGVIHTDLLRAGLIADPFDGDNEATHQWIGDTVWRYQTRFDWRDDGHSRQDLVAYGLDTFATVELNGRILGRTENQHRSYRFDMRSVLVEGANTLAITFAAPVPETAWRAERYGAKPRVNHHEYNQVRKTASHFGWDWGIDVAGCGIWRPIGVDSWSGVRIASVRPLVDVEPVDGAAPVGVLQTHVEIERDGVASAADVDVSVTVGSVVEAGVVAAEAVGTVVTARVPGAELWWPVGHGQQPLYDVTVAAADTEWRSRVGFRTVSVDTTPDTAGIPFALTVNDEAVLVRGVNWIPDHAFLTAIDRDRYARRLGDALEANVNLIRVWGGGIYESDDFFELADEHGLLVWQDFLFACAAYSEEEHLAVEVEAEARAQITRLSTHPSLVIWNGNNENTWGWADWGWRARIGDGTWGKGYYEELFPSLLAELDPTRFYSPASPYSFGDFLHPNDQRNGTTHIWDVWNLEDYSVYRRYKPRFVSEFGFQGPPAWSTLTGVVHDDPLDPCGEQMLVHQKASLGNEKLERGQNGHLPASTTIDHWHWATQLNQAHAIRFGVEHFRSLTPHNSGTILWQLNDNWPVVSWAAVDFGEHRKPLWYALRDAYSPRLGTIQPRASQHAIDAAFDGAQPEDDVLAFVLINDTDVPIEEASFAARRVAFDGTLLASAVLELSVPARTASSVELPGEVAAFGDCATEIIVVEPADAVSTRTLGVARAVWNPAEVVDQRLDPDALTAAATRTETGYAIQVTATTYVRDAFLQVDRIDPSATVDIGLVTLLAGEPATFTIASEPDNDPDAFTAPSVLRSANRLHAPQS